MTSVYWRPVLGLILCFICEKWVVRLCSPFTSRIYISSLPHHIPIYHLLSSYFVPGTEIKPHTTVGERHINTSLLLWDNSRCQIHVGWPGWAQVFMGPLGVLWPKDSLLGNTEQEAGKLGRELDYLWLCRLCQSSDFFWQWEWLKVFKLRGDIPYALWAIVKVMDWKRWVWIQGDLLEGQCNSPSEGWQRLE